MAIQKDIPFCPLMSVAANIDMGYIANFSAFSASQICHDMPPCFFSLVYPSVNKNIPKV